VNNYNSIQTVQDTPVILTPKTSATSRELAEITYALAENTAFRDKLKAVLTKQALDNTAALASMESYYCVFAYSDESLRFVFTDGTEETVL